MAIVNGQYVNQDRLPRYSQRQRTPQMVPFQQGMNQQDYRLYQQNFNRKYGQSRPTLGSLRFNPQSPPTLNVQRGPFMAGDAGRLTLTPANNQGAYQQPTSTDLGTAPPAPPMPTQMPAPQQPSLRQMAQEPYPLGHVGPPIPPGTMLGKISNNEAIGGGTMYDAAERGMYSGIDNHPAVAEMRRIAENPTQGPAPQLGYSPQVSGNMIVSAPPQGMGRPSDINSAYRDRGTPYSRSLEQRSIQLGGTTPEMRQQNMDQVYQNAQGNGGYYQFADGRRGSSKVMQGQNGGLRLVGPKSQMDYDPEAFTQQREANWDQQVARSGKESLRGRRTQAVADFKQGRLNAAQAEKDQLLADQRKYNLQQQALRNPNADPVITGALAAGMTPEQMQQFQQQRDQQDILGRIASGPGAAEYFKDLNLGEKPMFQQDLETGVNNIESLAQQDAKDTGVATSPSEKLKAQYVSLVDGAYQKWANGEASREELLSYLQGESQKYKGLSGLKNPAMELAQRISDEMARRAAEEKRIQDNYNTYTNSAPYQTQLPTWDRPFSGL